MRSAHTTAALTLLYARRWPVINAKCRAGCALSAPHASPPIPPSSPHNPQQRLYPIIPLSFKHPHTHQPEVMRLVARVLHSWEVMRNRNALNSRSGIHRRGCVCACVCMCVRACLPPQVLEHLNLQSVWSRQRNSKYIGFESFRNSGYLQRMGFSGAPGPVEVYGAEGYSWDKK